MPNVQRRLVATGVHHEVACAVRTDGVTSPAAEFLTTLEAGGFELPKVPDMEPDEQVEHYDWLEAAWEYFADNSEFPGPRRSHDELVDGVWEIRRFNIRIAFFDTDGRGGHDPKIDGSGHDLNRAGPPLPEFDRYVRLSCAWVKPPTQRKTNPSDINFARGIRWEDLQHDKPSD